MNYKQNQKILQLTEDSIIIGIDIAKHKHVARAQDHRGLQFDRHLWFENTSDGFRSLLDWLDVLMTTHKKRNVVIGMEPTGHYWLPLAYWLLEKQYKVVGVNPAHVKKSKELDDNSPTKNDVKDARVISRLIQDGRYSVPHLPEGEYAELREGMTLHEQLSRDLQAVHGRVHQWIDKYFPEYTTVFTNWEGKASIQILKLSLLPRELASVDETKLLSEIRKEVQRGVGLKKVRQLQEAARQTIGMTQNQSIAKLKIQTLMEQYEFLKSKMKDVWESIEETLSDLPGVKEMTAINGIGKTTVAAFLAEVGDLNQYDHPDQIIKLAGLNLKRSSSGKMDGQTVISKRGRPKLRALLFRVILPLVCHNPAFKAIHEHFTTRDQNPLKKKQSLIALCCKLIRILFTVGKRQVEFDADRMLSDIPHLRLSKIA